MKNILNIVLLVALFSCTTKNKTEQETTLEATSISKNDDEAIKPIKPCDFFNQDQLAKVFDIKDKSTIEMYARDNFRLNTNQCQFIWQEEKGSVKGSQIMIDITHKTPDDGATFSRMLELKLKNGLTARENNQTITIMPTPLEGFNDFAFHWTQPNFQNVQIIAFQVNNNYMVEITFNCHMGIEVSQEDIKNKLIEIGNQIKRSLNN